MDGNQSVGAAFTASFFGQQPEDRPSSWRPTPSGPDGYIRLFGGALVQRADDDPLVEIAPAAQANRWLPERVLTDISGARAIVNRPSAREHLDVVLVDSPNGVYFGARRLGTGYLWRVGGRVESAQKGIVRSLVTGVLEKRGVEGRIGLIVLPNAPRSGGWAAVTVDEWQESLRELEASSGGRLRVQQINSVPQLMQAMRDGWCLAVINPYAEWLPALPKGGIEATLESIRHFVQNGGHWFEVGGYPFFYALQPAPYFSMRVSYPPAFADFLHWETLSGNASLYRVQPRDWQPWDREHLFVPGWLAWGGDENGGYAEHAFGTYVPAGSRWRAPVVRLHVGKTVQQALQMYAKANGIHRRLSQKRCHHPNSSAGRDASPDYPNRPVAAAGGATRFPGTTGTTRVEPKARYRCSGHAGSLASLEQNHARRVAPRTARITSGERMERSRSCYFLRGRDQPGTGRGRYPLVRYRESLWGAGPCGRRVGTDAGTHQTLRAKRGYLVGDGWLLVFHRELPAARWLATAGHRHERFGDAGATDWRR